MGGKSKTSQRTKNNVRPSSSGRSAGLLSAPGGSFGGGAGAGTGGSLLAALAREPALPDSLALAFKKLNKKDPITKIKGLQELSQAVSVVPQDAVAALGAWAAQYRLLATDPDRRVRDHAQQCHGALMSVCGRAAAPQLRALLPVWLLSAHEPGAPAARALHALTATFPGPRLDDAIRHCKDDIAALLHDILTTPILDDKIESAADEEAMSMCAWRAVCALGALQRLAGAAGGGGEWGESRVGALLDDKHFWKLVHHSDRNVRGAWYGCVGRLGALGLLGAAAARVMSRLVAPVDSGAANAARFSALIQLMQHYPQQWHEWVDQGLLDTRIMNLLESGGWGCARTLHAAVLQLMTLLPSEALTARFYCRLFDALFKGMQCCSVSLSGSERWWWTALVRQCMQQCACAAHGRRLLPDVLQRWLTTALTLTKQRTQWVEVTARSVAHLALQWLRARAQHAEQLAALWAAAHNVPTTHGDIHTHMRLLHTMSTCLHDNKRPPFREHANNGVTFKEQCTVHLIDMEDKTQSELTCNSVDSLKSEHSESSHKPRAREQSPPPPALRDEYMTELRVLVAKAVAYWLDSGAKSSSLEAVIPPLLPVVSAVNCPELWSAVAEQCGTADVLELYRTKLSHWLRAEPSAEPPAEPPAALAAMLVLMTQQAAQDQREQIYHDWEQLPDAVVQELVCAGVSGGGGGGWRGGARADAVLQRGARGALHGHPQAMRTLHAALTDPAITAMSLQSVSDILVEHLSAALRAPAAVERVPAAALGPACELAALLSAALANAPLPHTHAHFVLAMWKLVTLTQPDGGVLSTAEWSEAACAACQALRALDGEHRDAAVPEIEATIRDYVFNSVEESLPLCALSHGAALYALLSRCIPPAAAAALVAKSRGHGTARARALTAALRADLVNGTLTTPLHDHYSPLQKIIEDSECLELTEETLVLFLKELLFRAKVIHNLVKKRNTDIGNENETESNRECEQTSKDTHALYKESNAASHQTIQLLVTDVNKQISAHDAVDDVPRHHDDATSPANDQQRNLNESVDTNPQLQVQENGLKVEHEYSSASTNNRDFNVNESVDNKLQVFDEVETVNPPVDDVESADKVTPPVDDVESADKVTPPVDDVESADKVKPPVDDIESADEVTPPVDDVESADEVVPCAVWSSVRCAGDVAWLTQPCADVLHDHAVLEALLRNYPYWSSYPLLSSTHKQVSATCTRVLQQLPRRARTALLRALAGAAGTGGHYWAAASLRWGAATHQGGQGGDLSANGYFHTLQMQSLQADATFALSVRWAVCMRCAHAALAAQDAVAAAALTAVADSDHEHERADVLLKLYYEQPGALHVHCPGVVPSWLVSCAAASCARYLCALVTSRGWQLVAPHWDLATLAACNYLTAAHQLITHNHSTNTKVWMLVAAALELVAAVHAFTSSVPSRAVQQQPLPHVAALPREWADVFAPHLTPLIHDLLLHVLETYVDVELPCTVVAVLRALEPSVGWSAGGAAAARARLLPAAVAALAAPAHSALHATAYAALAATAQQLAEDDEAMLSAWGSQRAEEEDAQRARPRLAAGVMAAGLRAALRGGGGYGALLLAEALARLTRGSDDKDIGVHYAHLYEEHDFIEPLLEWCLARLPAALAAHALGSAPAPAPAPAHQAALFLSEPNPRVTDCVSAETVSALCCRALYTVLTGPSVGRARAWYGAADVRARRAVERLVRAYIAPQHIKHVIATLHAHRDQFDDAELIMHHTTGEITVSLLVDDKRVALGCELGELFPLCAARLRGAGLAAAPALAARGALGGGVRRALLLWANAVRRRIDQQPPCYVCYSRLHPASGQLPNAPCRTCANKFHSQCIRKWFVTSQKANCPLCRSMF